MPTTTTQPADVESQVLHLLASMAEADTRADYATIADAFDQVQRLIASGKIDRDQVQRIARDLGGGDVEAAT